MSDQHHPSLRCDWQYLKANSCISLNDNLHILKRNNTRISPPLPLNTVSQSASISRFSKLPRSGPQGRSFGNLSRGSRKATRSKKITGPSTSPPTARPDLCCCATDPIPLAPRAFRSISPFDQCHTFHSTRVARTIITTQKTWRSRRVGIRCAAAAPRGAVSTLATVTPSSPGT